MDLSYTWSPDKEGDLASLDEEPQECGPTATQVIKIIGAMGAVHPTGPSTPAPPAWSAGERQRLLSQVVKSARLRGRQRTRT